VGESYQTWHIVRLFFHGLGVAEISADMNRRLGDIVLALPFSVIVRFVYVKAKKAGFHAVIARRGDRFYYALHVVFVPFVSESYRLASYFHFYDLL
jgi:hypothetical protein